LLTIPAHGLIRKRCSLADVLVFRHHVNRFSALGGTMRFGYAIVLIGILACSEAPQTSSPFAPHDSTNGPTVSPPDITAQYVLLLVNGSPPPSRSPVGAGEWDYDGATCELVSAALAFRSDDTYVETWAHRCTNSSGLITQQFTGTYIRISKSELRIGAAATVATLTDTGLVWQFGDFTLTYGLSK
jgi:hypothetical protein